MPELATPPAPTAAPSKPAAALPARTPVQSPAENPADSWMGDAADELESLDPDHKPEASKAKPTARSAKPAAETASEEVPAIPKKEQTPNEELDERAADTGDPKPETPVKPEPDPATMGARDLRKAYEVSQKKIREELQPKLSHLETRNRELEEQVARGAGEPTERFKALEKRNAELEAHIRFVDYQESQEFKDKYRAPFLEAWDRARFDIAELTVELPDGSTRPATDDDIQMLAGLPLGDRIKKANAMFGDASPDVRRHVDRIRELSDAQIRAQQDARKNAAELSEKRNAQSREEAGTRKKLWEQSNRDLAEKYPTYFAPTEGDEEGNTTLKKGLALTNLLFHPGKIPEDELALLPKFIQDDVATKGTISPENIVRVHALIRNRAANHDRVVRQLKAVRTELAEAKKSLAEYEASEPGTGGSNRRRPEGDHYDPNADAAAELDELDRKGPR